MTRWEYLQVTFDYNKGNWVLNGKESRNWDKYAAQPAVFNDLGDQGWELVATLIGVLGAGTCTTGFVFKRPKS